LFAAAAKSKKQRKMEELQLLHRPMFGFYKATEIMALFDVFDELPKKKLIEEDDQFTSFHDDQDAEIDSVADSVESEANKSLTDFVVSDVVIPSVDVENIVQSTTEGAPTERSKSAQKVTDEEVLLVDLMKLRFVHLRPHFLESLDALCIQRQIEGIRKDKIYISLKDALLYMCPLMNVQERQDTLKFVNLHVREHVVRDVQHEEMLSEEELLHMRTLFEFMDKDRSGKVDKDEILSALHADHKDDEKLEMDRLAGSDSKDIIAAGDREFGLEHEIVKILKNHDGSELDFEEFVDLFKDML
jgi:hypothetical protein